MELSSSNIKKLLIFSQKKAISGNGTFLYFRKRRPWKKSYIRENGNPVKIIYISGNGAFLYISWNWHPIKLLIFKEITFRAQKIKRNHSSKISYILGNWSFSPKLKKLFFGEPLKVFHNCFLRCFYFSPLIFTSFLGVFIKRNSSWLIFESIKALEIKTSILFNLDFAKNTILSCLFFLLLIIDLCFNSCSYCTNYKSYAELGIPIIIQ